MVDYYYDVSIGAYGRDLEAGPVFSMDGKLQLIVLRPVKRGQLNAQDAFVLPDFSRPKVGEFGTFAAALWGGVVPFTQEPTNG